MTTTFAPSFTASDFAAPRARLLANLGCAHGQPSARLRHQINDAIAGLLERVRPRAEVRTYPVTVRNGRVHIGLDTTFKSVKLAGALKSCYAAHVFVATLGRGVDSFVQHAMRRRPQFGVVADTVTSIAAEALVDRLEEELSENLSSWEALSLPFSPGYCDWPVDEQHKIFGLLPDRPAGVTLSADAAMSPRKSVSGVLGVGPVGAVTESSNPCVACPRVDCPHRRFPHRKDR